MATNSVLGKLDLNEEQEEEENEEDQEEALSLCDLPVTMINHNDQPRKQEHHHPDHVQEEFDFHGLFSKEPEMCVADEVFFQGQILPFRHSFSSNSGLLKSESLGNGYGSLISEFHSNSSRSSSLSSQNSSNSTSSTTTTATTILPRISKPSSVTPRPDDWPHSSNNTSLSSTFRSQFHSHPSPKPQLKSSGPRQASFGRKSSVWEILRLGVVPAPEIGLQDLKVRSSKNCVVSRNSSNSSSNSDNKLSSKTATTHHHGDKGNHILKQLVGKGGGLLSGCDCSIETVQCVSDMAMIKGGTNKKESATTTTHAVKEKVVVVELKKQKQRKKQGKKVMSRRRTFEWLKELHAIHLDDDDEEALLSNPPVT